MSFQKSTFSAKLFILGMTLVFFFHVYLSFIIHSSGKQVFNTIIQHLGYYCIFLSFLICLMEGSLKYLKPIYKKWLFYVLGYILILFLIGFLNDNYFSKPLYHTAVDCFSFVYFAGILVSCKNRNLRLLDRMLTLHFFIGSILCAYGLMHSNSLTPIDLRFSPVYEFWSNLMYGWPYFFLTLNRGSIYRKIIAISGIFLYVLIAILVLKRLPFIMILLHLYFLRSLVKKQNYYERINTFSKSKILGTFKLVTGVCVFFLCLNIFGVFNISENANKNYGISGMYQRLFHVDKSEKTDNVFDTLNQNYRFAYEPIMVFENATKYDIIFGRGIGATIPAPDVSIDGMSGTLHNGLLVFILKGGIVFLVIWYSGMWISIKKFFKNKKYSLIPYFSIIIVTTIVSPVGAFLTPTNHFGLVMIAIGRVASKD